MLFLLLEASELQWQTNFIKKLTEKKRRLYGVFFYIYKNNIMKKTLILLSFCSLFLFACPPPQEMTAFQKIEYKAVTRGSSQQIILEKGTYTYFKNNKETFKKELSKKHYKDLFKLLKDIDLETIDKIEMPSNKHRYDGALFTTIEIQSKGSTYTSLGFDHDNPPKELKKLAEYLLHLVE